jgi:chromosome partitioning protein
MTRLQNARVIVVGNEKGGSGKSTTAIHLIVALLGLGWRVASIDADSRQRSLTRYLDNRCITATRTRRPLPMPVHEALDPLVAGDAPDALEQQLVSALVKFSREHDIVIIDTPGSHCAVSRLCHAFADILVTPINDSFVDLDVLAKVESIGDDAGERFRIRKPSHYAEVVWEARKDRAGRDGGTIDWIVMRNRLSSLDARNKRRIETVLADLSQRFGFRLAPGFGERVIYRELFVGGLTLMDLGEGDGADPLTLSHIAARQEVRALVEALRLKLPQVYPIAKAG